MEYYYDTGNTSILAYRISVSRKKIVFFPGEKYLRMLTRMPSRHQVFDIIEPS
jgi:hypothetical protein